MSVHPKHTRLTTTVSQTCRLTLVLGVGPVIGLSPSGYDSNGRPHPAHVEYEPLGFGAHRRGRWVQLVQEEPPAELRRAEVELGIAEGTWWIASAPYWYREASGQERMRAARCWVRSES